MQRMIIFAGVLCLAGAGWISADMISSSISVDGSSWIKSSITGDRSYASLMFTSDRATVTRGLDFGDAIESQVQVSSSGPVGIREYTAQVTKPDISSDACLFIRETDGPIREDEILTSGLWRTLNYSGVRTVAENLTSAGTDISGVGMVSLSKQSRTANQTQDERAVAAGVMNVSEFVSYGGRI